MTTVLSPAQIFHHQQAVVSRGVAALNRHQDGLDALLASLPTAPHPSPRVADCSSAWEALGLLERASPSRGLANVDAPEARVLLALTAVVDEVAALARWLQDHAFAWLCAQHRPVALLVDASRAGKRMCKLVRNLLLQVEGIARVRPSGFKLDAAAHWVTLGAGVAALACMDALRPSLALVHACLAQDLPALSPLSRQAGAKVLSRMADSAQAPDEALACASLYILLHRGGHTGDAALFAKVWSLQLKVAPVVPVRRRVVILLNELLTAHAPPPSAAVRKPADPASARRAMANTMLDQAPKAARRAAFEAGVRPSLDLAERVRRFVDMLLALHATEKLPLPTTALAHLVVLLAVLQSLSGVAVAAPPVPAHPLTAKVRVLTPTRAVAVWISAGDASLAPPPCHALLRRYLRQLCDVAQLTLGFPELLCPLLDEAVASPHAANVLPCLLSAFSHPDDEPDWLRSLVAAVEERVVAPLATLVDEQLRLLTSPTLPPAPSVDKARALLALPPLRVGAGVPRISLNRRVARLLARRFHVLVCLDAKRAPLYREMRSLAESVFGVRVAADPLLPASALPRVGPLDVLRDVDAFASAYAYNLNQDFFVECAPSSLFSQPMTVDSIAAELAVHGTGVLSTVANACYQCLARRFEVLSQLLYDEPVRSYLKRERRWFQRERASAVASYPLERASAFARDAKPSLGAAFVPRARQVLGDIGNVLGFVRAMRSAARRVAAESPMQAQQPPQDFVAVLVDVFYASFKGGDEHLRSAFMLLPSLTLEHVDAALHAKDQVARGKSKAAIFTNDGFAMGMAAVLAVLGQAAAFEQLQWFSAVASSLAKADVEETKRRAKAAAREHEMLMFALHAALVLLEPRGRAQGEEVE